uniref:Uncharacterized protein n=1 Tax=Tetranychus urticae TaxID=32264 RepID=T1JR41_TETUR
MMISDEISRHWVNNSKPLNVLLLRKYLIRSSKDKKPYDPNFKKETVKRVKTPKEPSSRQPITSTPRVPGKPSTSPSAENKKSKPRLTPTKVSSKNSVLSLQSLPSNLSTPSKSSIVNSSAQSKATSSHVSTPSKTPTSNVSNSSKASSSNVTTPTKSNVPPKSSGSSKSLVQSRKLFNHPPKKIPRIEDNSNSQQNIKHDKPKVLSSDFKIPKKSKTETQEATLRKANNLFQNQLKILVYQMKQKQKLNQSRSKSQSQNNLQKSSNLMNQMKLLTKRKGAKHKDDAIQEKPKVKPPDRPNTSNFKPNISSTENSIKSRLNHSNSQHLKPHNTNLVNRAQLPQIPGEPPIDEILAAFDEIKSPDIAMKQFLHIQTVYPKSFILHKRRFQSLFKRILIDLFRDVNFFFKDNQVTMIIDQLSKLEMNNNDYWEEFICTWGKNYPQLGSNLSKKKNIQRAIEIFYAHLQATPILINLPTAKYLFEMKEFLAT